MAADALIADAARRPAPSTAAVAALLTNLISLLLLVIETLPICQPAARGPVPHSGKIRGKYAKCRNLTRLLELFRRFDTINLPKRPRRGPRSAGAVFFQRPKSS